MIDPNKHLATLARRDFLHHCGLGLGSIGLAALVAADSSLADDSTSPGPSRTRPNPLQPKPPHFPAKAKAVIQLFMAGGPSQLDLFDDKPKLKELSGQVVPKSYTDGKRFAFLKPNSKLLGTHRSFKRYGESGAVFSEALPHMSGIADDLSFIKTMHTDNFNHGPAKLLAQTGYQTFGHPTLGTWLLYGLGSVSQDLPGFVVLQSGPRGPRGGSYLWSNGFLSSTYQGVPLRSQGDPILNLGNPRGISSDRQQRAIKAVSKLNALRLAKTGDEEIAARTASYEMAFRMQSSAPDLIDISHESALTLKQYGVTPGQASFAFNCLLARRLVERGVRCVTLFHTEWDHHGGGENLEKHFDKVCAQVDQPTAALIQDLKQRGLYDETLVVWGGEFGRTPMGEVRSSTGRDHHIEAYTVALGGGGIKPGITVGETDELGFYPAEQSDRVHVHDLQATVLHQMGLDHLKLTHRFQGRDFRLTDVGGNVVRQITG